MEFYRKYAMYKNLYFSTKTHSSNKIRQIEFYIHIS